MCTRDVVAVPCKEKLTFGLYATDVTVTRTLASEFPSFHATEVNVLIGIWNVLVTMLQEYNMRFVVYP